jgi:hypothetical protein
MPLRKETRALYGAAWRRFRQVLIGIFGDVCSVCGIELAEGINAAHQHHDPRDWSQVTLMCPACHARHDAAQRYAMTRRTIARRTGQLWLLPAIEYAPYPLWEIPAEAIAAIEHQTELPL